MSNVPYVAVLRIAALSSVTYLGVSSGSATIFSWFLNLTAISGSLAWIVMFMAYLVSSSIPVFEAQKLTSA